MDLLRDWLDWLSGYDRRGVRALLLIVAINVVFVGFVIWSMRGSSGPQPLCPDGLYAIPREDHIECADKAEYDRWNQERITQTIATVIAENPGEATPPAGERTAN